MSLKHNEIDNCVSYNVVTEKKKKNINIVRFSTPHPNSETSIHRTNTWSTTVLHLSEMAFTDHSNFTFYSSLLTQQDSRLHHYVVLWYSIVWYGTVPIPS